MTTKTWVSDEVWARLDPSQVRLPRRTRLRVMTYCVVAAAVIALMLATTASGLVIHRIAASGGDVGGTDSHCRMALSIDNNGWFDERVQSSALRAHGTGAVLTGDLTGVTIPSGGSRPLVVRYTGAICQQLESGPAFQNGTLTPPDLVLHLHRPWGTSTDVVALAPAPFLDGLSIQL